MMFGQEVNENHQFQGFSLCSSGNPGFKIGQRRCNLSKGGRSCACPQLRVRWEWGTGLFGTLHTSSVEVIPVMYFKKLRVTLIFTSQHSPVCKQKIKAETIWPILAGADNDLPEFLAILISLCRLRWEAPSTWAGVMTVTQCKQGVASAAASPSSTPPSLPTGLTMAELCMWTTPPSTVPKWEAVNLSAPHAASQRITQWWASPFRVVTWEATKHRKSPDLAR